MALLLLLFAVTWLLAVLWLLLMGRLLNQLLRHDPEAYTALGTPVMRWLWWSCPTPEQGRSPFLSLSALAKGRLVLRTLYSIDESKAIVRLVGWIFFNRPRLAVTRATKRLQRILRGCGLLFGLGFVGVLLIAVLGISAG